MHRNKILIPILFCFSSILSFAQNSLGSIQANSNEALPSSYQFKEYVFAEPNDQGNCLGISNNTAKIEEVFLAQTHRHTLDHPFFFTIGHRPALLQIALSGSGRAPDVKVEGILDGNSIGVLCLKGPEQLSSNIDLSTPNFEDYFSVTLPKAWIQDGLALEITAGAEKRNISAEALKIGPYTEMNLVMVNMDILDYNGSPHQWPIFDDFLQELASSIPASVVRFGTFPETLKFPELVANNGNEQTVRLSTRSEKEAKGISSDGSINSVATLFLSNLHQSTHDFLSTIYFGNTLNLAPGGWGGGNSFVSFDYTDVFIHELGHALSLPHWGEAAYNLSNPEEYQFLYPYGGVGDNGGGRGSSWNFIQDTYEFVDPTCKDAENNNLGQERSDCMQRNNACIEGRTNGNGPWDGYGDFSAMAIHRYLVGASVYQGQVSDRGLMKDFQFNKQLGFPTLSLENGKRIYTRDPLKAQEITYQEWFDMPGEEQIEQDVYLIYGTAMESQEQANIVYKPVQFKGTLPPIIDPTDPTSFEELKNEKYRPFLSAPRDITLKLTYEDGSVLHALNPFHSYQRVPYTWGYHIWRNDICNFSLVVPGNKKLKKVELYQRPFCTRDKGDQTDGNINYEGHNITAENFMDEAVFLAEYTFGQAQKIGSNTIGNRVWHDVDRDGIEDPNEEGIAGVSLVLWRDSDGDNIPDWQGYSGVVKTDNEGYYSFAGLAPGNYLVFVWSVDNWGPGEPLEGLTPTEIFVEDPNTDINLDNNGRPGFDWGLTGRDIVSGMITLTAEGEPLEDGDREDDWFDFDPSGNMTIDFGFYGDRIVNTKNEFDAEIKVYPNPSYDSVYIEMEQFQGGSVQIIDLNGKSLIQSVLVGKVSKINLATLSKGTYTLIVKNKSGEIKSTQQLVKIK